MLCKTTNFATILQLMSLRATHKKLISVFLITLYAFIVTPTQWWHHHEMDTQQTSLSTSIGKDTNSVQDAVGLNCKICSHHYSIADNNVGSLLMQHPVFTASQYCSTPPDQYLQYFRDITGRGPPATI